MPRIVRCDVLVIGSGGAGLRAAIELKDSNVDVLVVGKCQKRDAHTVLATGGINAALGNMDPEDSWHLHAADTIKDGGHINDTDAVMILCKNAPSAVGELAKWGTKFHTEKNGSITQRFFGAATYRRACFVGDHTGHAILNTLVDQVVRRRIKFRSGVYIFSLLHNKGAVNGALGLDVRAGRIVVFHSKAVILATGGHSRMFSRSSSRFWENNGDGIKLAYDLGAKFMDMEMFQFHPTGMLYPPAAEGILVTEAVRGEGGLLTNAKGERFMARYDKPRMELSARDVVARAIWSEVEAGRGTKRGGVWLDITHRPKSYILKRLPKMYEQFRKYAKIDISKQKMEVAPTAHYSMGGIYVDHKTGKTSVKNLYAIGEVTAGTHGGNRLGGNSLAEIMVFGRHTGQVVVKDVKGRNFAALDTKLVRQKEREFSSSLSGKGEDPVQVKEELQKMMWHHVGVIRNEKQMKQGLKLLKKFGGALKTGTNKRMNEKLIAALDVRNMLPTCEMILLSGLHRKESRGAHFRSDYPETRAEWKKTVICTPSKSGIAISTRPVKKVPDAIVKLYKQKAQIHHLE